MKFELGDAVQCTISGYKGIIVARTEHINGCIQYGVIGKASKGNTPEGFDFDEQQLKLTKKKKTTIKKEPVGGRTRPMKQMKRY